MMSQFVLTRATLGPPHSRAGRRRLTHPGSVVTIRRVGEENEPTRIARGEDDSTTSAQRGSGGAPVGAGPQIRVGSTLVDGRLRILQRLGQGGMGAVYLAQDDGRGALVALKTLNRLDAASVYRLKNEFRSLADVRHQNLCRLHELFHDLGEWFFTMEVVDGERFDEWVRGDEARLWAALPQLVEGICAIHAAGKLHRDLKPANVLVARDGRVVVLDFGLAVDPDIGGIGQTVEEYSVSGTPSYMAPEQAAGQPATVASDFYALGVMLYEGLTGQLPFSGRAGEVIAAKQLGAATAVRALVPEAPADLATICDALLAREPARRPNAAALRLTLAAVPTGTSETATSSGTWTPAASAHAPSPQAASSAVVLLGREFELAALREAFLRSCSGKKPVIVLLAGESGMGKSTLCEAFLGDLRARHRAVVLSGRCFERETVPFKAFDVVIDELSRHLRKLPERELFALLPRDAFALRRIFPVLGRLAAFAEAPERDVPAAYELRQRAFAAFGELLGRMCDRAPLVLHLDDLQWSDSDSTILLMHLLRQADAPRILLIASHRSEQTLGHPYLSPLYEVLPTDVRLDVQTLRLGPLAPDAAQSLLRQQFGTVPDALATEAGGNPFLLNELGRHALAHPHQPTTEVSLNSVLVARAAVLPEAGRRLLEVMSVAGRPVDLQLAVEAAGTNTAPRTLFEMLRDAQLARATGKGALVECFHDKVREALLAALTAETLREHHAAIAQALSVRPDSDAEQLAVHLLGSAQTDRAAVQLARAADSALAELSFDRAARLYTQALAHGRFEPADTQRLRIARGDALAEAGRGQLAAEAYLDAMPQATGEAQRALEHRAAEQYLFSGRIKDGRALMGRSLRRDGLRLPASPTGTLASLVFERLRLRLHGLDFRERTPAPASTELLDRMFSRSIELLRVDAVAGAVVHARYLRLGLHHGNATHVARALALEIFNRTMGIGEVAGVPDLVRRVEAQLARHDDPLARLWLDHCRGFYLATPPVLDLAAALADFDRYLALLDEIRPPNASYHRVLAQWHRAAIRVNLGRLAEVARELPDLLDTLFERGDYVTLPLCVGGLNALALVAVGAIDEAERQLARAATAWASCNNAYALQNPSMIIGAVFAALGRGEPRLVWARAQQELARFEGSPLRRVPLLAGVVRGSVAMAALALAAGAHGTERAELLGLVRAQHRKAPMPYLAPLVALGLANVEGPRAHAVDVARATLEQLQRDKTAPLFYHLARRACGVTLDGDEGAALVAEADAFLRAGGCEDPARFGSLWAPSGAWH